MHLKRSLSLVGVVGAAAAILITTAGAAPGPNKPTAKLQFTSSAAVLKYLKSHGVNTRGMVVQRGVRNYAGPKCPGKGWKCTRAHRVIQFAPLHGGNSFSCSPSYGTPGLPFPPDPTETLAPDTCIVVQVNTTGDNNAKCVEQTSADGANQYCAIWQENVSGKNNATVFQLIDQSSGQQQNGVQDADVTQDNGIGPNNSSVTQKIWQTTSTNDPTVDQDQQGQQFNHIEQTSVSGTHLSVMSQAVDQEATVGKKGKKHEHHSSEFAPLAKPTFTGSQNQYGDGRSTVNQSSTGVSKAYNFQNMEQEESAPKKNSTVTQDQLGPWRCCSSQGSNPNDVFYLQQSKSQFTTSETASSTLYESGFLNTTGHGHIDQFGNQNGETDSNTCDVNAGACSEELAGENGVFFDGCPDSVCGDYLTFGLAPKTSPNHRAFSLKRHR